MTDLFTYESWLFYLGMTDVMTFRDKGTDAMTAKRPSTAYNALPFSVPFSPQTTLMS
ncbi:hypothetical protein [Streptococcus acidominimus]|uniref:hypothetical protein n=1 Tax=Streptococcus acidominimus TaxID=1326 RepID=UPI0014311EC7|nr:hypothetical protein [Streptococcus acidominimus]MBF0839633.1 hypothetical protein [Streptococcus acidominimus]MBF0848975.1 hypothetical protein [Streptococcus danieliae]